MDEREKHPEASPSSRIDSLLREMEATVSTRKDKKTQQMISQLRKLAQLQNSTTATLEQTHEKLKTLEAELAEVQILREGILQLRKQAEQEEGILFHNVIKRFFLSINKPVIEKTKAHMPT